MNRYSGHVHSFIAKIIIAALPLAAGCRRDAPAAEPDEAKITTPVPVRCATATVMTLKPSIDLVGTLVAVPERTVSLSTQVSGQIQAVRVVEGQHVRAGDLLIQLDDRAARIQRDKTQGAVEEVRAVVARLKRGSRAEDIEAGRQELNRAQASLKLARNRLEAGMSVDASQVIPKLEMIQRKSAVEQAEADVAAKQSSLRLLEIGPRPEEIAEAEGKLAIVEADLAAGELALKLTQVMAPIDGVVTDLPIRQGMYISAGGTLLTLMDLSTLFVRTRLPAAYLSQLREGQSVDVQVASFANESLPASVTRVGQQADAQTGDVDVFASLPNPAGKLRPGLSCRPRLWLPEIANAIAIPLAAIADRDGTPVVTVVRENRAHEVEVRLGGRTDKWVQALNGLAAGELVAVEGGYGLPEGCPCKVEMETFAASTSAPESR